MISIKKNKYVRRQKQSVILNKNVCSHNVIALVHVEDPLFRIAFSLVSNTSFKNWIPSSIWSHIKKSVSTNFYNPSLLPLRIAHPCIRLKTQLQRLSEMNYRSVCSLYLSRLPLWRQFEVGGKPHPIIEIKCQRRFEIGCRSGLTFRVDYLSKYRID